MQPGNGAMKTGWQKIDGKWYFLNPNGAMRTGGWFNQGYVWYYLNGNGSMAEGWIRLGNTWYYMQPNSGHMRTGWYQVDKKWYYSDGSGAMQTGWLKPGNTWYYLTGNGAMAEGWTFINGSWYYLTPGNGAMKTGWFQVNKVWYYCNGSGAMQTGWLQLGNIWYYLNSSGAMLTGWHTLGGKEYYFNNSGAWVPDKKKDNTQNLYAIEGKSSVTVDQMVKYYKKSGCTYPSAALKKGGAADIKAFSKIVLEEANAEGIKAEVVFTQAMKETGWLQYGGDVKIEQFNFAGLGAIGNGAAGNSFKDVRTGIRAQVQHLKAYASDKALKNACVDERFQYVTRKSALYVEWLGIPDNPTGAGWAAAENYGKNLVEMITKLKSL